MLLITDEKALSCPIAYLYFGAHGFYVPTSYYSLATYNMQQYTRAAVGGGVLLSLIQIVRLFQESPIAQSKTYLRGGYLSEPILSAKYQ